MTESKLHYIIPESQQRVYKMADFLIGIGEDEKPCFKTWQCVKRNTLYQAWVRMGTESSDDLVSRLKTLTTEITQSLTLFPHLKQITMDKIIELRHAYVRIRNTYKNDGKAGISGDINSYILTLDMHIPEDVKAKFAIPIMKDPYTSPGIVPSLMSLVKNLNPLGSFPIETTPSNQIISSTATQPVSSPQIKKVSERSLSNNKNGVHTSSPPVLNLDKHNSSDLSSFGSSNLIQMMTDQNRERSESIGENIEYPDDFTISESPR
jgi:hypothetical protein